MSSKNESNIYKMYDIRGIYPSQINEENAYKIGRAFVSYLNCKYVAVAKDMRSSSDDLFSALTKGITDQGADVIDVGLCSTPMFYFACAEYESGIMVTASHNPKEYNGFKLCRERAIPLSGESGIDKIKILVEKNTFIDPKIKGKITKKDIVKSYVEHNLSFFKCNKKLRIVADAGNGMAGYIFPKVFSNIKNIEVVPMYFDLDSSFPNHEANPLKLENVASLQKRVIEEKADLGVAYDGDADRAMFIDEKGRYISADFSTALLGLSILKMHKKCHMLTDLRSSKVVSQVWEENGATTNLSRVGHALIKMQMIKENAIFAGELSGHYYFLNELKNVKYYGEDTILATILMLNLLDSTGKKMSELVDPLRKYYQSGEINFTVNDKDNMIDMLKKEFSDGKAFFLDGLSIDYNDWWFNVRPSNTENLLRLNLEANSKELLEIKLKKITDMIKKG